MSFNLKTGKELLKYYNEELRYLENLRHQFTIKSYLQILIIAIQIGVFGIVISNLFFSSHFFSNLVNSPILIVFLIMIILFGFVIFDSLLFNIKALAEKIWTRPILYQRFGIESKEDTSKTIETVMNKCYMDEDQIVINLLKKLAYSLTVYKENISQMKSNLRYGIVLLSIGLTILLVAILSLLGIFLFLV